MATAKITLMGMYHYDDTLFNSLTLPDGIDKDLLIQTLLLRGAEFEVLYSNPDFMKQAIAVWGAKWFRTFAEWLRGTQATWNPIHNYDRFEESKDDSHKKFDSKTDANRTDETTFDNTDTTSQTVDSTTQHDVSPYDAANFVPSSKDTINNGSSNVAHTGTVTNTTTGNLEDTSGNEYNTVMHGAHIYGNIGVTQASDMLRSFYDISQWNLYEHISDVFIGELLIPVYD